MKKIILSETRLLESYKLQGTSVLWVSCSYIYTSYNIHIGTIMLFSVTIATSAHSTIVVWTWQRISEHRQLGLLLYIDLLTL